MRDEDITAITRSWEAAAGAAGRKLPHNDVERALRLLPEAGIWAISQDAGALFALLSSEVVFTVLISHDDGTVRVKSRPHEGEKLRVLLTWGESGQTESRRDCLGDALGLSLRGRARGPRTVAAPRRIGGCRSGPRRALG